MVMFFFGLLVVTIAVVIPSTKVEIVPSTKVEVVPSVWQFSHNEIIPVDSFDDAIKRASDPYEDHTNVVYHIKSTDELFFHADQVSRTPQSTVEVPKEDGTEKLPEIHTNGLFDKVSDVLDSAENFDDRLRQKLPFSDSKTKPHANPLFLKALNWIVQKVDILEEKIMPEMLPVTPCLDSSYGDGGSILFSHGSTITTDSTHERSINMGYLLYLELKRKETNTLSTSYSYSISGTIPKGQMGQIFIKNPKIFTSSITQTFYTIADVLKKGLTQATKVDSLDYTSSHEYHFLTSDKYTLSCGASLLN